jgi:dihydropteroate synthase
MGVVNATPDSFHARSRTHGPEASVEAGLRMADEGADVLDVGGESTRPGARPVGVEEEAARVVPVVRGLCAARPGVPVSIDTYKAEVARRAVEAGATIVNDVSGGRLDPAMAGVVAELGAVVIVGHLRGTPETMREAPEYRDVVEEVRDELAARIEDFRTAGVAEERIWIDPGFGFGKRAAASRALLFGLRGLEALGRPIVVGLSRKSFLGDALRRAGLDDPGSDARLEASLAAAVIAAERGAVLVRAHDVLPTRRALAVLEGVGG